MKLLWGQSQKRFEEALDRVEQLKIDNQLLAKKIITIQDQKKIITPGPSSSQDEPEVGFGALTASIKLLLPDYNFEVVPIIRKLTHINPDVSQAFNDVVRLANTGHKVIFDPSVGADQIDKMRDFIQYSSKFWHVGAAGMHGIVNKMFRQVGVGGATAIEWVPNIKLDNLEETRFVYPERVRWVQDRNNQKYQPYQKLKHRRITDPTKDLKKLNINQFHYTALNGDTDLPYGIPPYMSVLEPVASQRSMLKNIDFIMETLGVLGWVDGRIQKPTQGAGESDEKFEARCIALLTKFKERVKSGTRDGLLIGFQEDHEFEFNQTAKTAQGATDLFDANELLIASALGVDAAFLGRPGSTETLVTILFTKMIAQLKNIQDIVADNLEFGYTLALTLGGFNFKRLAIVFNRSTLTDDLKYQQALEYKLNNLALLYDQGIISQEQFADEAGYTRPDQSEPRVERDPLKIEEAKAKRKEADKKAASDRKGRDKKNPQGTTRGPRKSKATAKELADSNRTTLQGHYFEITSNRR